MRMRRQVSPNIIDCTYMYIHNIMVETRVSIYISCLDHIIVFQQYVSAVITSI